MKKFRILRLGFLLPVVAGVVLSVGCGQGDPLVVQDSSQKVAQDPISAGDDLAVTTAAVQTTAGAEDAADALPEDSTEETSAETAAETSAETAEENLDGVAKDGVAKDGVAKDGVAKDGVAKDGVAKDGVAKENAKLPLEPLFVDWPQPQVALVFTGRQFGFLEPCGCSGLENQKGGLVRRSTLLRQLAEKGWPVIPIDAGNQVRRFGRQAEIKLQITIEGLRKMGYRAIAFGPDDLKLPAPELVPMIASSGNEPSTFVCANVTVLDASFTSPYLVLEQGGKKIGITSVLGERNQKTVMNDDITFRSADEGLQAVWPKLEAERCDLYVLIAHASMEESVALAQQFPQFPLVVTTSCAGEPTMNPEPVEGTRSQLIQIGTKGMYASVIGLFDDADNRIRYQRVPLDARFPDSQDMLQLLAAYQEQLKDAGFEGLGIRPQPHPSGLAFVGSHECEECHEDEYKIWKNGVDGHEAKHSHAYATLQHPPKRSKIPRNFDPECISCHVIGWNPQKYFPYKSGFLNLEETPELINVGCENCHGPGSAHAAAENGDVEADEDELDQLRKEQLIDLEKAEQKCMQCHDLDNSPAFQEKGAFDRYWEKIKHGSK